MIECSDAWLKQKIQEEMKWNSEQLRNDEPKSERRKSVLFVRIEMLKWVLGLLESRKQELRQMIKTLEEDMQGKSGFGKPYRKYSIGCCNKILLLKEVLGKEDSE